MDNMELIKKAFNIGMIQYQEEMTAFCDFIKGKERCRKCGCYMNVKQRWATSNCKIGKW